MQRTALKVTGIYLFVAGGWIFFSDRIALFLINDADVLTRISIAKGLLFTVVTGTMLYWLINRDVKQISESRDFYLKVFQDFPALIWRSALDAKCDYFNNTWLAFTGRTLEQEMGDGWTEGVHPEDFDYCLATYMQAFDARLPFSMEYRLRRHDGEYRWIIDHGRPYYGLSGEFAGYIGSCYDVTERKESEYAIEQLNGSLAQRAEELELANKKLVVANDELEAFNYTVSHDLRSPVANIALAVQMIHDSSDEELSENVREYLSIIGRETERMDELISALLNLSQVAQQKLQCESVDLTEIARMIVAELQHSDPLRRVKFTIAEGLTAEGDPKLLRLVLQNLIGNAWKYSRMQKDAAICFGADDSDDGRTFFIRDNGTGFDMKQAHRLFGTFQRLHGNDFDGFGIGLATVQRIILRHGGRVWAEGEPGKGATFYFTFP